MVELVDTGDLKSPGISVLVRVQLGAPPVSLAQWIEHRSSTPLVGRSNRSGDANSEVLLNEKIYWY